MFASDARGLVRFCHASAICIAVFMLGGCAVQTPPVTLREQPQSIETQRKAQTNAVGAADTAPRLKRKVALGRISNETRYGQSLLRDQNDDPLGKQVTDLLSKSLTESGSYLVFERPDLSRIQAESKLTGTKQTLVGVDALIMGSLTEFGRKTLGEKGFASSSKRQVAFAKVDLRLVDVSTGHVFFATSGAGEASTETASTFGFGSQAGYDSTLNDAAIRQAISEAVARLSTELENRPWNTAILSVEQDQIYISGGKAQGLRPGTSLVIQTAGQKVKSPQTGFEITLPGKSVATIQVLSNFGDSETNEGSIVKVTSGSIAGYSIDQLVVSKPTSARS